MNIITFDFETFWDQDYTLSKMTTEEYVRDLRFHAHLVGFRIDVPEGGCLRRGWVPHAQIPGLLEDLDIEGNACNAHHAHFDGLILKHHYGHRPRRWFDTLSMARGVHGGRLGGNSLAKLKSHYDLMRKRDEVVQSTRGKRSLTSAELTELGDYCMEDVDDTYHLLLLMFGHFTPLEFQLIDQTVRMFTEPVLRLNPTVLEEYLARLLAEKNDLLLGAACGPDVLRSDDQLAELLISLGVKPPMKVSPRTKKWAYAFAKTDQKFKDLLEHPDERVQAVVAARLGVKTTINESRAQRLLGMSKRGPACVYVNYCGAEHTGRDSGGDKTNWQNFTRAKYDDNGDMIETSGLLRKAVEPPPGKVLVVGDSANIEKRVLVTWAGQADAVDRFRKKQDPYKFLASRIYEKPIETITKPERFLGKTADLGLGYQMGAPKFVATCASQGLKISLDFGYKVVNVFRGTNDRVEALWEQCREALPEIHGGNMMQLGTSVDIRTTHEKILLPSGREITYKALHKGIEEDTGRPGWFFDGGRKGKHLKIYGGKVVENIVQSLARDIVLWQAAVIQQRMKEILTPEEWNDMILAGEALVPLRVHDEVVVCVPQHHAEATKELMEEVMSRPPSWWPTVPIACEVDYGLNYRDAKP